MIAIFAVLVTALFIQDNSEFIQDMNDKGGVGCTFSYTGKQYAREDVPHCRGRHIHLLHDGAM